MTAFVKNGLTLLGILVIAGLGYYLFIINGDSELQSSADIGEAEAASEQFLRELNNLESYTLSDALFTDARFRSFIDFTTPIPGQPVGRENPFAPVQ